MRVLFMGGSRFMGPAIVRALVRAGHDVTVCNRGTRPLGWPEVREVVADRDAPGALAPLAHERFDVVVDQSAYTAAQTSALLDVVGDVEVLVHCSSGAVYAPVPELPWAETTPMGPWPLWGAYGREKLACEQLLRRRRAGRATTVLRLPYVLGPGNYAAREEFVLNRLLDRAPLYLPGDGQAVVHLVSVEQVAAAFLGAVRTAPGTGWRAFNVAGPGAVTSLEGFVRLCEEVTGLEARLLRTGRDHLVGGAFEPDACCFCFPNAPCLLDGGAAERAGLGVQAVGVRQMIADAHEHLLAHPERRSWEPTAGERAAAAALVG
jgi:nucleoside-diphosphate-sugar epimerase